MALLQNSFQVLNLICPKNSSNAISTGLPFYVGCICNPGFSGLIRSQFDGFNFSFQGMCVSVTCPANSSGNGVGTTDIFYSYQIGMLVPSIASYTCLGAPENNIGIHCSGCTCNPGFQGSVIASINAPNFYTSTCIAVFCNSSESIGDNVPMGCYCRPGFSGSVIATALAPLYYNSSCIPVNCPVNSIGINVVKGCRCNSGFNGSVIATTVAPTFFISTCQPVPCPVNSIGSNVATGCTCRTPDKQITQVSGIIEPSNISPFYSGSCDTAVSFRQIGPFSWTAPFSGKLTVTVVAGGGAGGGYGSGGQNPQYGGGGGGAGGVLVSYDFSVTAGKTYYGIIGAGGNSQYDDVSNNGQNSIFSDLIAFGGGRGSGFGSQYLSGTMGGIYACVTGGSGGGGSTAGVYAVINNNNLGCGVSAIGQGNPGGNGTNVFSSYPLPYGSLPSSAGGGGALTRGFSSVGMVTTYLNGLGQNTTGGSIAGAGGDGIRIPYGQIRHVGGGGGGCGTISGAGGLGGGGNGGKNVFAGSSNGENGVINTGGGGGGSQFGQAGNGGSGYVIFDYTQFTCDPGYDGIVTLNSIICTPVVCPLNSIGINITSGCLCILPFYGTIVPSSLSPFYTGRCSYYPLDAYEFKNPGPLSWIAPLSGTISVVVIGGGGAGGSQGLTQLNQQNMAGGGGAGGIMFATISVIAGHVYTGFNGLGGNHVNLEVKPTKAQDSNFSDIIARGGGYGSGYGSLVPGGWYQCTVGGSGGGAAGAGGYNLGCSGIELQGKNGGNGTNFYSALPTPYGSNPSSGGGGGAGSVGATSTGIKLLYQFLTVNQQGTKAGDGGDGIVLPFGSIFYAGGGGGGSGSISGKGGKGGGGNGATVITNGGADGFSGENNTGGGGGASHNRYGGSGGSGFVAIKYKNANCNAGYSGNITISTYNCVPVACPINSTGQNIPTGCVCNSPMFGSISGTTTFPYFNGICSYYPLEFYEFKNTGNLSWLASVSGVLSVFLVAGGGAGAGKGYIYI